MFAGFVAILFLASRLVPGRRFETSRPDSSERHIYSLNGLALFALVAGIVALSQGLGWISLSAVYERIAALFLVANIFAFALAFLLFARGRGVARGKRALDNKVAAAIRDFYLGALRDPAWLGVNLKLFSYRPSLIGLALINASFAVAQYGAHGSLSAPMILYQIFTFLYVLNFFQFEYGMVHTWDMNSERFGWMLVWGDYVLVPFLYSLPAWFLVDSANSMPVWAIFALVALFLFGMLLFRGANEQKHRFKQDSGATIWGRPAQSIDGRLLVSGYWGIGRHLNYTGEVCIYFAFTMTTGFDSFVPYLLPLWLMGLLAHRAWRDDRRCRSKYGDLWMRYTELVRFRMVPYVY